MNPNNITPMYHTVLVKMDKLEEGIILTGNEQQQQYAMKTGEIIAKGSHAFSELPETERPKVGQRFFTNSYEGENLTDLVGKEEDYRVMQDSQVLILINDKESK